MRPMERRRRSRRLRERYWVERRLDEQYNLVGVNFDELAADLLAEMVK
ncbi:MAG: hypothetical protein H6633_35780 [Anaerolineales bacterium]|nr:hypothetical protein [Anaerolineales bacterium]